VASAVAACRCLGGFLRVFGRVHNEQGSRRRTVAQPVIGREMRAGFLGVARCLIVPNPYEDPRCQETDSP